jgi:hypothetical protein
MKMFLLKILVVLVILIAVLCIIAAFAPKKYVITREITINKPAENVYEYLRFLNHHREFNQWLKYDPNTKIELKGNADGQEGAILSFESEHEKCGKGEFENVRLIKNKQIDFKIRFMAPYVFTADGTLFVNAVNENQTNLVWKYQGGKDWPMNIILLFVNMDKIIGADIESTMRNIKTNTEKL